MYSSHLLLHIVEFIAYGPCQTFKRDIRQIVERLEDVAKALDNAATFLGGPFPNLGRVFRFLSNIIDKPISPLRRFLAYVDGNFCGAMTEAEKKGRLVIKALEVVDIAASALGIAVESFSHIACGIGDGMITLSNVLPSVKDGSCDFASSISHELQALNGFVNSFVRNEAANRFKQFVEGFENSIGDSLKKLHSDWEAFEQIINDFIDGFNEVLQYISPFDEFFEVISSLDCSKVPILSTRKFRILYTDF